MKWFGEAYVQRVAKIDQIHVAFSPHKNKSCTLRAFCLKVRAADDWADKQQKTEQLKLKTILKRQHQHHLFHLPVKYQILKRQETMNTQLRRLRELQDILERIDDQIECPICLDTLTDTHIVPSCQHRFCGDCIKQSLSKCNNQCPSCRIHIPTRRSLRADPIFDAVVSINC